MKPDSQTTSERLLKITKDMVRIYDKTDTSSPEWIERQKKAMPLKECDPLTETTPLERYRQMEAALKGIVRGCEALLLDAELSEQPVNRKVLKLVLDNARSGLRGIE